LSALTRRRLKRGSFHSIVDLQAAIHRYIAEHNDDPRPFSWTKTPQQILAKSTPMNASVHFCNGALGVKSLTVVPVAGVSLLSVVGPDAAT
jgi:hypothetical protein